MNTAELRMSIIEKLLLLDDVALEKLNSLVEKEIEYYSIPESHYKVLDQNKEAYLKGERKLHTLEAFKEGIKKKHGI